MFKFCTSSNLLFYYELLIGTQPTVLECIVIFLQSDWSTLSNVFERRASTGSVLFEAGRALFMNNSLKINSRKSSRVLMVKVVLKLISSHLKGRQSKTIPKSADGVHGTAFT